MNHVSIAQWTDGTWAYQLRIPAKAHDGQWWPGFDTAHAALSRGLADLDKVKNFDHIYFVHLSRIWQRYFDGRDGKGPAADRIHSMDERDKEITQLQRTYRERPQHLTTPGPTPAWSPRPKPPLAKGMNKPVVKPLKAAKPTVLTADDL